MRGYLLDRMADVGLGPRRISSGKPDPRSCGSGAGRRSGPAIHGRCRPGRRRRPALRTAPVPQRERGLDRGAVRPALGSVVVVGGAGLRPVDVILAAVNDHIGCLSSLAPMIAGIVIVGIQVHLGQ